MRTEQRLSRIEKRVRLRAPGQIRFIIAGCGDRMSFCSLGQPEITLEEMQAGVIAERGYRVRLEEIERGGSFHKCRIVPADDLTPEELQRMAAWKAAHPEVPPEPVDPGNWE